MRFLLSIIAIFMVAMSAEAQNLPQRKLVRQGNKLYNKGDFKSSANRYSDAVIADSTLFEARYNLGNALYKSESYEGAEKQMGIAAADSLQSDLTRSEAFYNLGNAQFQQKKYQEALESYKNSMRLNPDDQEAKYNYAYTKRLLENQDQNQDQQNQDQNKDQQNQDQNQDQQNQDQNQDQQDQGDENKDQQDQGDQNQDQGDENESEGQPQPQDGQISEQEQNQMLDAIQAQEDKTQDKLKEKGKGIVVRGNKNW